MNNLSEILKILDGALKSNVSMAANYAGLLADKLQESGEHQQAKLIRERLMRAPTATAFAQDGSRGFTQTSLPTDGESRLHTVDISHPQDTDLSLMLPSAVLTRINDFVESVNHFDQLASAGASMPNRMLIYGPPGTGKTQTAKWLAAKLRLPLLTVRCDTLISSLLGQTSRNLRSVFEYSQLAPNILFLDEFDALAAARGNERDVGELQRIVIALLQNIDALPDNTILIAATNHDQLLDPAIWRRFSFRIEMGLPTGELRTNLWRHMIGNFAPSHLDWATLTSASGGLTGAQIQQVCLDAKRRAVVDGKPVLDEQELFRRLGLAIATNKRERLDTRDEEMIWLRNWNKGMFSLRKLAKLYATTTHHVTEVTNGTRTLEHGTGKGRSAQGTSTKRFQSSSAS